MSQTSHKLLPWTPRQLALAGLLLACAVAAMGSSWADWATFSWNDEEYSHVFLVVPFGAAILYVNRRRFRGLTGQTSWAGPLMVAGGWLMAWYGYNYAHQSLWHMGAVLVAVGAVVTVIGHAVLLRFWPIFLMLGFMVPLSNQTRFRIADPLQTAMAITVERILGFFGEPVTRQANLLTINGQQVGIAEACNGMRMVFTLILVCWLFAFVTPLKNWVRWTIILMSPLTALVCNVLRLIPTLLLYGHASAPVAKNFHDWAGWAMVPVAFLFLMLVIGLIEALGFDVRQDDDDGDGLKEKVPAGAVVATVP